VRSRTTTGWVMGGVLLGLLLGMTPQAAWGDPCEGALNRIFLCAEDRRHNEPADSGNPFRFVDKRCLNFEVEVFGNAIPAELFNQDYNTTYGRVRTNVQSYSEIGEPGKYLVFPGERSNVFVLFSRVRGQENRKLQGHVYLRREHPDLGVSEHFVRPDGFLTAGVSPQDEIEGCLDLNFSTFEKRVIKIRDLDFTFQGGQGHPDQNIVIIPYTGYSTFFGACEECPKFTLQYRNNVSSMVHIPGGTLQRGRNYLPGEQAGQDAVDDDESQLHWITVNDFYLDQHEVTNIEYAAFIADGGYTKSQYWSPQGWLWKEANVSRTVDSRGNVSYDPLSAPLYYGRGEERHPIVGVSWYEAEAFANWAGKRLPTEAEWEYAARSGSLGYAYPFGNRGYYDSDDTGGPGDKTWVARHEDCLNMANVRACFPKTGLSGERGALSVGTMPLTPWFKLADVAGNVWEWTYDWHSPTYYHDLNMSSSELAPAANPLGPCPDNDPACLLAMRGPLKVMRGGGYFSNHLRVVHLGHRQAMHPHSRALDIGFRCAWDPAMPPPRPLP
jgi:formylglycine-generating enzyme